MDRKTIILIAAASFLLAACGNSTSSTPKERAVDTISGNAADTTIYAPPSQGVEGGVSFTMGKVVAARYSDLSFEHALPVGRVMVKNGQYVRRGQILASQDTYSLRKDVEQNCQAVEQARLQIEQANLQMQDVIIAQGYDPAAAVPANVRHNADMKAGYTLAKSRLAAAEVQLAAARHQLSTATLIAPFDGVIANLTIQPHQLATAGSPVCRVIASGEMQVEFRVMETDLRQYPMNTKVEVVPVADKQHSYQAVVCEINPVVDAQGAVTLRARLTDAEGLYDGMNVELRRIEK